MVTEPEKTEETKEEEQQPEQCTEEVKADLVNKINACREAVKKLMNIAPDTVPHYLQLLAELPEDQTRTKLDEMLSGYEDDAARMAFCQALVIAMSATAKNMERFEADLKLRTQPDDAPRVRRKFQGFRKRRGSW